MSMTLDELAESLRAMLDERDRMKADIERLEVAANMVLSTVHAPDNGIRMVVMRGKSELGDEVLEFVLRANAAILARESVTIRQPCLDGGRGAIKSAMTRLSERVCSALFQAAMKAFD